MRLVDTSAWIEWLIDSSTGRGLSDRLPEQKDWLVPTIVQFELAKWLARESSEERADQIVAYTQLCIVAALDTKIALSASELSTKYKLSTADAIVYATALEYGADLITCDAHFKGLHDVIYVAKKN
jgi:predicted nucleic acid-binding protein